MRRAGWVVMAGIAALVMAAPAVATDSYGLARATSAVAITTTTATTDVPGATLTYTCAGGERWTASAVFHAAAAVGLNVNGRLALDGALETGSGHLTGAASATVAQQWSGTCAAGEHTWKLQVNGSGSSGSGTVHATNTSLIVEVNDGDQTSSGGGSVAWADITGKPATFPPDAHTHDDRYFTETESDERYAPAGTLADNCGTASAPCVVEFDEAGNAVSLSAPDAQRLDLIWLGLALIFGTSLGVMVGRWLSTEMRGWGGGT